jgi:filamentous hemagglutinin family protein
MRIDHVPVAAGRAVTLFALLICQAAAKAPIVFDSSLGKPGGALSGSDIPADRGVRNGGNLFHSFSRFNVGKGGTANFQTQADTTNILARVTGGEVSNINGTVRADGPANLYLINPAGVMFGNGARVNVAGSFTATTADYIGMRGKDGVAHRFWAATDGMTTLVSAPPASFGFLKTSTGGEVRISLTDQPGQIANDGLFATGNFSAVARKISVSDSIVLFDGGSLDFRTSGPGELPLAPGPTPPPAASGGGAITFTNTVFESPGKSFHASAAGNLRADRSVIASADGFLPGAPEKIQLNAIRDLTLTSSSIQKPNFGTTNGGAIGLDAGRNLSLTANSSIESTALAAGRGGDVSLRAGKDLPLDAYGLVSSSATAHGPGGTIRIVAGGTLSLTRFGLIQSAATGSGAAGVIRVRAGEISISGQTKWQPGAPGRATGIQSLTEASGLGGDIHVRSADSIAIRDTGGIFAATSGSGRSGSIRVNAGSLAITGARNYSASESAIRPDNFFITGISMKNSRDTTSGGLGSILVDVKHDITLKRGGLIDASSFSLNPDARAGSVTVTAASLYADRAGSDYFTGIGSGTVADRDSGGTAAASGGKVNLTATTIRLHNGAQISASSRSGGDAGTIGVKTRDLLASGTGSETDFLFTGESGIVAATRGQATGGAGGVSVESSGGNAKLVLTDWAQISARAEGSGGGGSVDVDFHDGAVSLDNGASISARSGTFGGNAGSVRIRAAELSVSNAASVSSTNAAPPSIGGDAGSVTLWPGALTVSGGRLEVSAAGGNAGRIAIHGGGLLDFRQAGIVAEAHLNGGDLLIDGARHLLMDHSRVSANAELGDGGRIALAAGVILSNSSRVTASSTFGTDGIVRIDPQSVLSGAEDREDPQPLNATDVLQPECTDRLATEAGSFIRAGRGSTPRLPGGYLPSIRLHRLPE